jgi:O-antigen/teichoic acid export membrane protein
MSKQSRLIKNTIILLVGIVGTKLVNFILLPFLTTWFSVEEYGTIDIFLTMVSMIVPFCSLQLEQAVFRFLIDDTTIQERKSTVSSGIFCTLTVLAILNVITGPILLSIGIPLYGLFLLAVNLQTIYVMVQQVVRGKGQNHVYTINSIVFAFATMLFCVIFIRGLSFGVKGYVFAYCLANVLAIFFMLAKSNLFEMISLKSFNLEKLMMMLRYSIPMIANNVSWWILNASDKIVLNLFIGTSANGIFAAAGKIPGLITTVYSVFQMAWQESTSRELKANEDLDDFYSEVFRSLFVIMSFGVITIILLSKLLFPVLINIKFEEAFYHIPILLIGLFFLCLAQFYGGIYVGLHNSKELGWTSAVAAGVNIAVDLISVKHIGIYAASISTLVAYLSLFIIRAYNTSKTILIKYKKNEIAIISFAMCIALLACYLVNVYLQVALLFIITAIYWIMFKDIVKSFLALASRRKKRLK